MEVLPLQLPLTAELLYGIQEALIETNMLGVSAEVGLSMLLPCVET